MEPKTRGWLAGCGCGCVTYLFVFVVVGAGVVGAFWAAYEADVIRIGAEVAMPLGAVAGLIVGGLTGLIVLVVVQRKAGAG